MVPLETGVPDGGDSAVRNARMRCGAAGPEPAFLTAAIAL